MLWLWLPACKFACEWVKKYTHIEHSQKAINAIQRTVIVFISLHKKVLLKQAKIFWYVCDAAVYKQRELVNGLQSQCSLYVTHIDICYASSHKSQYVLSLQQRRQWTKNREVKRVYTHIQYAVMYISYIHNFVFVPIVHYNAQWKSCNSNQSIGSHQLFSRVAFLFTAC